MSWEDRGRGTASPWVLLPEVYYTLTGAWTLHHATGDHWRGRNLAGAVFLLGWRKQRQLRCWMTCSVLHAFWKLSSSMVMNFFFCGPKFAPVVRFVWWSRRSCWCGGGSVFVLRLVYVSELWRLCHKQLILCDASYKHSLLCLKRVRRLSILWFIAG